MTKEEEREYERSWHLDRKVPIAIIVTLLLNTGGFIWWAAKSDARIEAVEKQVAASTPHSERITRMEVKIENVERGVVRIENLIQSRPLSSPLISR
jgi:hypothetical protein